MKRLALCLCLALLVASWRGGNDDQPPPRLRASEIDQHVDCEHTPSGCKLVVYFKVTNDEINRSAHLGMCYLDGQMQPADGYLAGRRYRRAAPSS